MCSTERKYPTDKPWAFISPSAARTAQGRAQGLPCKSDTYFSNGPTALVRNQLRRGLDLAKLGCNLKPLISCGTHHSHQSRLRLRLRGRTR